MYQERLLSRRVLHFGHSELHWECLEDTACKCTRTSTVMSGSANSKRIREGYIPCIIGHRETTTKHSEDEYLVGLWRKMILQDLCWTGVRVEDKRGSGKDSDLESTCMVLGFC
jgi:hypothetical protein